MIFRAWETHAQTSAASTQMHSGRGAGTFQHAEVHGVVGSLGHAEHHLQAIFNLPLSFLTAREELL